MKGEWRSAILVLSLAVALTSWVTEPHADGHAKGHP